MKYDTLEEKGKVNRLSIDHAEMSFNHPQNARVNQMVAPPN